MSKTMAVLSVIFTLIGSIFVGGITLGEMRGGVRENTHNIGVQREIVNNLKSEQEDLIKLLYQLKADITWIKENLKERR